MKLSLCKMCILSRYSRSRRGRTLKGIAYAKRAFTLDLVSVEGQSVMIKLCMVYEANLISFFYHRWFIFIVCLSFRYKVSTFSLTKVYFFTDLAVEDLCSHKSEVQSI